MAILAVVALAYFSTESLGGSAYLATFVMGLMVGNMEMLGLGHHDEHATLLEGFLGQVAEIATLLVFVTLGLNLPFEALGQYFLGGLLVMFVFIFVARPITVLACLLPDRRGGWTGREIAFISWCRETGVIPAAVASLLLARGVEGAEIAVSMVALAVCVTLLLQATTAGYVSPPSRPVRFLARLRSTRADKRVSALSAYRYLFLGVLVVWGTLPGRQGHDEGDGANPTQEHED